MTNPEPAEAVQFPSGTALLQLCLEQATVFPETHDQNTWFSLHADLDADGNVTTCGSTGCLAGHAVSLGAHSTLRVDLGWLREERIANVVDVIVHEEHGDRIRDVGEFAAELMDLDDDERRFMFDADRTLDELWAYAEWLYPGEIARPDAEQIEKIRADGPRMPEMFSRLVPEDGDGGVTSTSAAL